MKTREKLKDLAYREIDQRGSEIIGIAKHIRDNPEPGFREFKTSRLVSDWFAHLDIPHKTDIGITGIKGILDTSFTGPTVGIMGELDSLIVPSHPYADPDTGAAHACGHHAQIAMLIGVSIGLKAQGLLRSLSGRIALMAVPAEEYIEIEYRDRLRQNGELEFLGGKPEFIRLGELDDVDMAILTHTAANTPGTYKLGWGATNNGTVAKKIVFLGRSAHAGGLPQMGINALNAATLAINGIHSIRETFRDQDTVRVHPIITKGGDFVSAVPDDVHMETFVRASSVEAIKEASEKVDRALRAGALAVGGQVKIVTIPGYLPIINYRTLGEIYRPNAIAQVGEDNIAALPHRTGSTDMGDVSQIMPTLHPYVAGAVGNSHSNDYVVEDYALAVISAAKAMTGTVIDLLADGASLGRELMASSRPPMSKPEYLNFMRSMSKEEIYQSSDL